MPLTTAERHVLFAALRAHKLGLPGRTHEALRDEAVSRAFLEDPPIDAASAIASLLAAGRLEEDAASALVRIASREIESATSLQSQESMREFDAWITAAERSPTYLRFCERVYGMPLAQFGLVDAAQMELLVETAGLRAGVRVADLGCGAGTVAEYLSDRTGAHVTGVDFAAGCVARATERTRDKASRLRFEVGDMNHLALPAASFDVVMSIDTLYFVDDVSRTVGDALRLLAPGGRFVAFYSEGVREGDDLSRLEPDATRVARALASHGRAYTTVELTERERAFWSLCRETAASLRDDFAAEGNLALYKANAWETSVALPLFEQRRIRRYLYTTTA